MKQFKTIEQLQKIFPKVTGLEIALLYGSFGRNEGSANSDIDIQLLVNKDFDSGCLMDQVQKEFDKEIQSIREVRLRNKVVVYFKCQPKIEFAICSDISDIERDYLGSEITDYKHTILYQNSPQSYDLDNYLPQLLLKFERNKTSLALENQVAALIDKFIYEFESCSNAHKRSDGYKFYFYYNISLQIAIQLNHLSKGETKFNFLPKNFISNVLRKEEQKSFYDLRGSLYLPDANNLKRKLLDFFYAAVQILRTENEYLELKQFCEWIYQRDFLWNFRDISLNNSKIKPGIVFRTATMSLFQNENFFDEFIAEKKIKTVIDLRSDKEIEEFPYDQSAQLKFNYIKAQLNPWEQPEWFKEKYHYGTNEEIAYRFFVIACKDKIRTAIEAIIHQEEGAVAVHCFAGKDRTGIFITLLHLLIDTPEAYIYNDYLASENDIKKHHLDIVLEIIKQEGGVVNYFLSCGVSENQISQLKLKLKDGK